MRLTRILIAVDDSEPSARALELGARQAVALGAQVGLVHVVSTWPFSVSDSGRPAEILLSHCRQRSQVVLLQAVSCVAALRPTPFLREGKPADEILAAAAEWGAHLIVIGTHRRNRLRRLLFGSTAESVARRATCSVLTAQVQGEPHDSYAHTLHPDPARSSAWL